MNTDRAAANQLVDVVVERALMVSNKLGAGFLEKVYENALADELRQAGLKVEQQRPVEVHYDGVVMGAPIWPIWWSKTCWSSS